MSFFKDTDGFYSATPTSGWQDGYQTAAPSPSVTMIIFVSNDTGFDTDGTGASQGDGSKAHPYKTIAKAYTRTGHYDGPRPNSPDWILLATGETWTDQVGPYFFGHGLNEQNRMIFSSYDKTATISAPSNPPLPNPRTGVVARPIVKTPIGPFHGGMEFLGTHTAVFGIDFYCYTRDTVANPANAGNPMTHDGIGTTATSNSNLLIEDNVVRWYDNGITVDMAPDNGPVSIRRNVVHNCWGDKFGIGSFGITPGYLLEENFVDHCGWDAVGQPDGASLNHNFYISGNNTLGGPGNTGLGDLYMHGNISMNSLMQENNRTGGHFNNNLWQLGGTGGTNFGPNNPAITNLVENEVFVGGFLGGASHLASTSEAIGMGDAALVPDDNGGYYGNNVPGIKPVLINRCIVTQGVGGGVASGGLLAAGTVTWAGLLTVSNCISYKFSGTTVYTGTVTNGGGNLGTNSPTTAASFGWPHPERTPETYMAEVIHDGSTWADFGRRCRLQSRRNWNPLLMAESVNDYIRQGFGMSMVGSAYADTQAQPPQVLMPQICMGLKDLVVIWATVPRRST